MITGNVISTTTTASSTPDMAKIQAMASKYMQITRDGDTFTSSVDLVGLFSDADFQALVASGEKAAPLTDNDKAAIESLQGREG